MGEDGVDSGALSRVTKEKQKRERRERRRRDIRYEVDKGDNTCFRLVLLVRSLGGKQQQRRPSRRRLRRSRFFPRRLFLRRRPRSSCECCLFERDSRDV